MEDDTEAGAQARPGRLDSAGQEHVASSEDASEMVPPSDVLVHGRGGVDDVLQVLQDIEEAWMKSAATSVRTADTMGTPTRTFSNQNEFAKLVNRVKESKAHVVLRKLFVVYSGQCSVMQEIWVQDKSNPDAARNPFKSYAVVHVHHHWHTRVNRIVDITAEHLEIVDAINARHITDRGSQRYQGDNPFYATFIEPSGGSTLKVFPEGWTCRLCRQTNLSHHTDCRGPDWNCPSPRCRYALCHDK